MSIKSIISITTLLVVLLQGICATADDVYDNELTDESSYNNKDKDIYEESESNEKFLNALFPSYDNTWWSIPDYDKTGMSEFDIIRTNMYYSYLRELGSIESIEATVEEALSLYQDNGSFPNLDYWAYEIETLPAARHFRYLRNMIAAYQLQDSKYYHSEDLYNKVITGMDFYANTVTRRYKKGESMINWWAYTIGHSHSIMPMLCISYGIIPDKYIDIYCNQFLYEPKQMTPGLVTGTNGVWYATQAIVKGALLEDEDTIREGIAVIHKMAKLQDVKEIAKGMDPFPLSNEGLQTDNSFHQHGPKYYYTYSNLFLDFANISMYFMGTQYEMSDLYDLIIDAIIDGWVWTAHYNYEDINQFGRRINSPDTMGGALVNPDTVYGRLSFCNILKKLSKIYPARAEECLEYANYFIEPSDADSKKLVGSKYFYRSDYLCHHRENWTLFNQLNSRRSNAAEYNVSLDQFTAYWMGFGHTFLYKGKDIYYGTYLGQPVFWDWTLIPGVTSSRYIHDFQVSGFFTHQNELFAGGISDGTYGMTAMKLTDRNGVNAKKSVFCFKDEFVSLGSGITSITDSEINTAIEQRRLYDKVEVDGTPIEKGEKNYIAVNSVLHYGIGYVFPNKEDVFIRNDKQYGAYSSVRREPGIDRTVYSEDMFTMYIPHGDNPVNDKYCYITIPETDSKGLKAYVKNNPIRIIANNEEQQAVYNTKENAGGAVFYKNGSVDFGNGLKIKSDSICCLLLSIENNKIKISVSNPYARRTTVNLDIEYLSNNYKLNFELPGVDKNGYDYGGKAVEQVICYE